MNNKRRNHMHEVWKNEKTGTVYARGIIPKTKIRVFRSAKSEKQVIKKVDDAIRAYELGLVSQLDDMTVSQYCDRWLEQHTADKNTVIRYRQELNHVVTFFGNLRMKDLRVGHVQDLTKYVPISDATTHGFCKRFKSVCKSAFKESVIEFNPWDHVDMPSKPKQKEARAFDDEEVQRLLSELEGTSIYTLTAFVLSTGVRIGEALALRWENIDLDRKSVLITENIVRREGETRIKSPKTNAGRRTIEISDVAVTMLRHHRTQQLFHRQSRLTQDKYWEDTGAVFSTDVGQFERTDVVGKPFTAALKSAGLYRDGVGWHALRHTYASQALRDGVDMFTLSRRLGHESVTFTMTVYGHLLSGQQSQAAQVMDKFFITAG